MDGQHFSATLDLFLILTITALSFSPSAHAKEWKGKE